MLSTNFRKIIILLLLNLNFGCTSFEISIPSHRLIPPETIGDGKNWRLSAGVGDAYEAKLVDDAANRPPNFGEKKISYNSRDVVYQLGYGLSDMFDISLGSTSGLGAPWMFGLKFQPIGESASKAKAGNFSLSIYNAIGSGSKTNSGDQSSTFGKGGYPWKVTGTNNVTDSSLLLGYRFVDNMVFYVAPFYTNYEIDVHINQDQSTTGDSPGATYTTSSNGYAKGSALGLLFDVADKDQIILEMTYIDIRLSGMNSSNDLTGGLLFNFYY